MQRLEPGVYLDRDGTPHIDATEMLEANGYQANLRNVGLVNTVARHMVSTMVTELRVMRAELQPPTET